jgi:hypothetical protein
MHEDHTVHLHFKGFYTLNPKAKESDKQIQYNHWLYCEDCKKNFTDAELVKRLTGGKLLQFEYV